MAAIDTRHCAANPRLLRTLPPWHDTGGLHAGCRFLSRHGRRFRDHRRSFGQVPSRLWTIVRGIVAVLAGAFVFANPVVVAGLTTSVVVSIIGVMAILSGVMEIVAAIKDRKQIEGEGWLILGGVLLVLIGMSLVATPLLFGISMVRLLGILAIASSIAMIVFAFRLKGLQSALNPPETLHEDTP